MNVLFYTDIPRLFRSTLIGYLYEIAKRYPVTLLSENLDEHTRRLIRDKRFFPKLKTIIPVSQFNGEKMSFRRYRYLSGLARNIIEKEKPQLVIATGIYPFETFLRRYARQKGALTISGIGPLYGKTSERRTFTLLSAAVLSRTPLFLLKWRKCAAQILYYILFPFLIGEKPFFGYPGFPLHAAYNRYKKGADYYFVFLKEDREALIKEGVPAEKLALLAHPLEGSGREFFERAYSEVIKEEPRSALILFPDERVGFKKIGYSLISKENIDEMNYKTIKHVTNILPGWYIIIKPHPTTKDTAKLQKAFGALPSVTITLPSASAEEYSKRAAVIIGLPPVSTALYTASLQCPKKPILSLDFQKELLGDSFKHTPGIEYIASERAFEKALSAIKKGTYQKKETAADKSAERAKQSIIKVIENLLEIKN